MTKRDEMTCRELVDFLSAYVDGELAPDERQRFARHLAACRECEAYLKSFEATVKLGRRAFSHPDDPAPAEVPDALLRAILAARRKGS